MNLSKCALFLTAMLLTPHAYAELPQALDMVKNGSNIPIVKIDGLEKDHDFYIDGASDSEIYGRSQFEVGIYDFSGKLKKVIHSGSVKSHIRDLHGIKKVGQRYYGLIANGWMVEADGDEWTYSNRKNENYDHLEQINYDEEGNTYSLRMFGDPEILIKEPGSHDYKSVVIPQLKYNQGHAARVYKFFTRKDGEIIVEGAILDDEMILVSKNRKDFDRIEMPEGFELLAMTPDNEFLVAKKGEGVTGLSLLDTDGQITNLDVVNDPAFAGAGYPIPEYIDFKRLRLPTNSGLLCFKTDPKSHKYCGYVRDRKLNSMQKLDTENYHVYFYDGLVGYHTE